MGYSEHTYKYNCIGPNSKSILLYNSLIAVSLQFQGASSRAAADARNVSAGWMATLTRTTARCGAVLTWLMSEYLNLIVEHVLKVFAYN